MSPPLSLINIKKSPAGTALPKEHSFFHTIRRENVAALGAAVPQAVDDLKSITSSDILTKAHSAAKVALDLTKEVSSALPLLNSVATGILVIIKHFEVSIS
jgi:uncharacterized membrane protein